MLLKRNKSSHVKARSVVITAPPQPARLYRAPAFPEVAQRAAAAGGREEEGAGGGGRTDSGPPVVRKPDSDAAPSGGQSQELPGHLWKVTDDYKDSIMCLTPWQFQRNQIRKNKKWRVLPRKRRWMNHINEGSPVPTPGGINTPDCDLWRSSFSEFACTFLLSVYFHFQQITFAFLRLSCSWILSFAETRTQSLLLWVESLWASGDTTGGPGGQNMTSWAQLLPAR